jgi:deoxyxylulose-5-phosphate synthase
LLNDGTEELEEIDRSMAVLQEKLVMSVNDNEKYDSITKQMDILRERKALILSKGAGYDALQKRIAEMKQFLETQTGRVTEYDEQMVRRLISKITVFEEKLIFEFKSGMTINLRR